MTYTEVHETDERQVMLSRAESMRLLATVRFGRIVFSHQALPAVRLVDHVVDSGMVIVRAPNSASVVPAVHEEIIVAYEADDVDPARTVGWTVTVTGTARLLTDADQIARYDEKLGPWAGHEPAQLIAIHPTIVTGVRLLDAA